MNKQIRIAGTVNDSIVDGPGIRYTIFTQGCPHHCPGCHNPQTWSFDGGKVVNTDDLVSELDRNPLLSGVTFSGGEPFMQPEPLIEIARIAKEKGLNVLSYTGFLYEEIIKDKDKFALLKELDYLIDGPFVLELRDLELKYAGSSNQRMIDVKKSLAFNRIITIPM